jgi:hypothetical protein
MKDVILLALLFSRRITSFILVIRLPTWSSLSDSLYKP